MCGTFYCVPPLWKGCILVVVVDFSLSLCVVDSSGGILNQTKIFNLSSSGAKTLVFTTFSQRSTLLALSLYKGAQGAAV